jgi:hypothetical protein
VQPTIVMINGAFGVGKTTVANGLLAQIPDSMLYDPEEVGQMLRKIGAGIRSADEKIGDFQDDPLWPALTVEVAKRLFNEYKRPLIIPMTLAHIPYFTTIKDGLAQLTADFHHFCLTASTATIHRRLIERGDEPSGWTFQRTARCVIAHRDPIFSEHISTEAIDPQKVQHYMLDRIQPS